MSGVLGEIWQLAGVPHFCGQSKPEIAQFPCQHTCLCVWVCVIWARQENFNFRFSSGAVVVSVFRPKTCKPQPPPPVDEIN